MATILTPEENARRVLGIFREHNSRAGHVLHPGNFWAAVADGFHEEDLKIGLDYAEKQGWVEGASNNSIRLTDAGFAQI